MPISCVIVCNGGTRSEEKEGLYNTLIPSLHTAVAKQVVATPAPTAEEGQTIQGMTAWMGTTSHCRGRTEEVTGSPKRLPLCRLRPSLRDAGARGAWATGACVRMGCSKWLSGVGPYRARKGLSLNRSTEGMLLFMALAPHAKQLIEAHTLRSGWGRTANVFEVRWEDPFRWSHSEICIWLDADGDSAPVAICPSS